MEINNIIREQICSDLKAGLVDEAGGPMVATFFNGQPTFISVPEFENDESDIPAVSVSVSEGQSVDEDFEEITWRSILTIRIYLVADNNTDKELDALGEKVLSVITKHYTANGLLDLCNRHSFDYARDEEQPWGTLDLAFNIEYTEEV
ncbi:phage tail terminator protein [Vibrio natriegens]